MRTALTADEPRPRPHGLRLFGATTTICCAPAAVATTLTFQLDVPIVPSTLPCAAPTTTVTWKA